MSQTRSVSDRLTGRRISCMSNDEEYSCRRPLQTHTGAERIGVSGGTAVSASLSDRAKVFEHRLHAGPFSLEVVPATDNGRSSDDAREGGAFEAVSTVPATGRDVEPIERGALTFARRVPETRGPSATSPSKSGLTRWSSMVTSFVVGAPTVTIQHMRCSWGHSRGWSTATRRAASCTWTKAVWTCRVTSNAGGRASTIPRYVDGRVVFNRTGPCCGSLPKPIDAGEPMDRNQRYREAYRRHRRRREPAERTGERYR